MRKPSTAVLLWTYLALWMLWALLPARAARASEISDLEGRDTLRVLAVISAEETFFVAPRESPRPGFDVEILEGFARLHKLKLDVVPVQGWDGLIPALRRNDGDLIAGGLAATESRRKSIEFTTEVFPSRSVVLTRRPDKVLESIEEVKARKVGTVKGTFIEEELAAAGVVNVDRTIPAGGIPAALKAGRVNTAADAIEAALTAKAKDPDLQLGAFLGRPTSLAYGVRKDDQALLGALNAYISNLRRTSTWSRLVVKYFGAAAPEILKKARAR